MWAARGNEQDDEGPWGDGFFNGGDLQRASVPIWAKRSPTIV